MTPAFLRYLARLVFEPLPPEDDDIVEVWDENGRPLRVPRSAVSQVLAAALAPTPPGAEETATDPVWHLSLDSLREVCEIARSAESIDDAIITIYANTTWH